MIVELQPYLDEVSGAKGTAVYHIFNKVQVFVYQHQTHVL